MTLPRFCPNRLPSRSRAIACSAARVLGWLTLAALVLGCRPAHANNPRWVTGPPYFSTAGVPVVWYTRTPLYYTDPGDLSSYVNHAAADALVAAAADVWNVPTADFTIAQGGQLAEHVDGSNSYLGSTGVVFPSDVQTSHYTNIQIAVLYDTDGSITDLLLGQGASAPAECLQNGVTESVDQISTAGRIQHAILVLNGRCTGPAPEQQLQLQYELERAFGRIFGVGWSQTNDNVFTHTPQPTYEQALHWPIMHPIDIVCGPYTYQCLPQPFTLRDDDVASISQLYPLGFDFEFWWIGYDQWLPGKTQTYDRAADLYGTLNFPNGQGMEGVNVVVQRLYMFNLTPEPFYDSSNVSGFRYARTLGNPVTGPPVTMDDSMGSTDPSLEGWFDVGWVPMIDNNQAWVDLLISTEPVNPLYTGAHAVGPYTSATVTPSGTTAPVQVNGLYPNDPGFDSMYAGITATGGASSCNAGPDGTESSPQPVPATGWWTDTLCGVGHSAWSSLTIAPGHTATLEVTTLDENGIATENKMQPLLGVWNASDPTGTTPTYAASSGPFNTIAVATTALTLGGASGGVGGSDPAGNGALRIAITDARGDGRPDYNYKARVLYASSVQPSASSLDGSPFTLSGMGFRSGNEVLVNGVSATVSSWSANTISAVAPPSSAFSTAPSGPVDITVRDLQTGASTTIYGALTYTSQPPDLLTLLSTPSGTVPVDTAASAPFSVRVLLPDGVTPVASVPVIFASAGPSVQLTGCTGNPCIAVTDSTGLASVTATPLAYGDVTLTAGAVGALQTAAFHAQSHAVSATAASLYVAAGATVSWSPSATLLQDGLPASSVPVQWTGSAALALSATGVSGANGVSQATAAVGPLSAAAQASGQVCGWTTPGALSACAPLVAVGVDPAILWPTIASGAGQSIGSGATFAPVVLQITDPAGHPVAGAVATIHQTVDQAQMPCPARGACPPAAQLASSVNTAVSDTQGHVAVIPLQVSGTPAVTQIAVTTGAQGFVSLSLTQGQ